MPLFTRFPPGYQYDVILILLISLRFALSTQTVLSTPLQRDQYAPSVESATANANIIINAIHSAARQWGSSVHHNGLSLFQVTVPEGTLLYHGNPCAETPAIPEWLAFEIEHAEFFARKIIGYPLKCSKEKVAFSNNAHHNIPASLPGYLHMYQANRPLRLIYFDGMSAATASPLGPSDMQEFMFLNRTYRECCHGILDYAKEMCRKGAEWGVEGFVRMEAGFEIIKCNFSDGLDLISSSQRPLRTTPEGQNEGRLFSWLEAIALRYNGIDASRFTIDFSSMIHAGFYPTNLSNPEPESHLPRLISADPMQLARINADARSLWLKEKPQDGVDWQGAIDMIKKRYSDRLQYLASKPPYELFRQTINSLLNTFVNYESFSIEESIKKCTSHYLRPVKISSEQDTLIYAAAQAVTHMICTTVFEVREDIFTQEKTRGPEFVDISNSVASIQKLINWLDWSEWKRCKSLCLYGQLCFIPVNPFGTKDLYDNPRCLNSCEIEEVARSKDNYWFPDKLWSPETGQFEHPPL